MVKCGWLLKEPLYCALHRLWDVLLPGNTPLLVKVRGEGVPHSNCLPRCMVAPERCDVLKSRLLWHGGRWRDGAPGGPLQVVVKNAGGLDACLRVVWAESDDPSVHAPLGGELAKSALHHHPGTAQTVVIHPLCPREVVAWPGTHHVPAEGEGLISDEHMRQWSTLLCSWNQGVFREVKGAVYQRLAKQGVGQRTRVVGLPKKLRLVWIDPCDAATSGSNPRPNKDHHKYLPFDIPQEDKAILANLGLTKKLRLYETRAKF